MPTEIYADFEWDSGKRSYNLDKHGFDFTDAISFFAGIIEDKVATRVVAGETRYLAIGVINQTIAAVVYTDRQNRRRIISIRKARTYERGSYLAHLARLTNRMG